MENNEELSISDELSLDDNDIDISPPQHNNTYINESLEEPKIKEETNIIEEPVINPPKSISETVKANVGGKEYTINKKFLDIITLGKIEINGRIFLDRDSGYFPEISKLVDSYSYDKSKIDNLENVNPKLLAEIYNYGLCDKIYEPIQICTIKKKVSTEKNGLMLIICNDLKIITTISTINKIPKLIAYSKNNVINLSGVIQPSHCRDFINCLRYGKVYIHNQDIIEIFKTFEIQLEKNRKLQKNLKIINSMSDYIVSGVYCEHKVLCSTSDSIGGEIKFVIQNTKSLSDLWLIVDYPMTSGKLVYSENFEKKIIKKIYFYNNKIQTYYEYTSLCELQKPNVNVYTIRTDNNGHKDVKRVSINIYNNKMKNYDKLKIKIILNNSENYTDYKLKDIVPYSGTIISKHTNNFEKPRDFFNSLECVTSKNIRIDDYISEVVFNCYRRISEFIFPDYNQNIIKITLCSGKNEQNYNYYYNNEINKNDKYFKLCDVEDYIYVDKIKLLLFDVDTDILKIHYKFIEKL